jgi:hypothetical protein
MTVRAADDFAAIHARLVELQRERESLVSEGEPDTGRREQENPPRPNYRTTGPQRRFVPRETT